MYDFFSLVAHDLELRIYNDSAKFNWKTIDYLIISAAALPAYQYNTIIGMRKKKYQQRGVPCPCAHPHPAFEHWV